MIQIYDDRLEIQHASDPIATFKFKDFAYRVKFDGKHIFAFEKMNTPYTSRSAWIPSDLKNIDIFEKAYETYLKEKNDE